MGITSREISISRIRNRVETANFGQFWFPAKLEPPQQYFYQFLHSQKETPFLNQNQCPGGAAICAQCIKSEFATVLDWFNLDTGGVSLVNDSLESIITHKCRNKFYSCIIVFYFLLHHHFMMVQQRTS